MATNIPMWIAIFVTLSHVCEVTDVLSDVMIVVGVDNIEVIVTDVMIVVGVDMFPDVMIAVGVDMFPDIEVIVKATAAIALGFVVGVAYAGVLTALLFDVVSVINVDMLADENTNSLAAVTTP